MSQIKFSRLISVSSEDPRHPGSNLLKPEISGCWKCKDNGEKQAIIILQLEKLCRIQSITIGNENSAFIELLVGKSAVPDTYEVLRVASVLMSVQDAKNDSNKNIVRFFKSEEFTQSVADQSWDRLKIICSQPFNKHVQYGLSFVKVHGKTDVTENSVISSEKKKIPTLGNFTFKDDEKEDDQPKVGSYFARRNDVDSSLSTAAAIRAASNDPLDALNSPKRLSDVLQNLKENKRKRKQDDTTAVTPLDDDGRRSTAGPLLYVDNLSENEMSEIPKKKKVTDEKVSHTTRKKSPEVLNLTREMNESNESLRNVKYKPFNLLLEDVVFVISGFQNPYRADLRSKALQMGAKYNADWTSKCTHLICAFTNTPKSNQVRSKGWIVRKEWIEDCHKLRKRLKCSRYKLDENDSFTNSNDEEIWEEKGDVTHPVPSSLRKPAKFQKLPSSSTKVTTTRNVKAVSPSRSIYDMETDVDSDMENSSIKSYEDHTLKILPDFFDQKTFYLGTDLLSTVVKLLRRYIIAYKGNVLDDVNTVNFIISKDCKYKENITNTPVILPDWIWECNDRKSLSSYEHYLLN